MSPLIPRTPASFMLGQGLPGAGTVVYLRARMGARAGAQVALLLPMFMPWPSIPKTPASFMLQLMVVYLRAQMGEEAGSPSTAA